MNPLSPLTYYRRHKRSAILLVALVALATAVLYTMVGVLDSLTLQLDYSYLSCVSRVRPEVGQHLEPGVSAQIRAHPDVEHVVPDNGLTISVPTLAGIDSVRLIGASEEHVPLLMERCGVHLREGRLPTPRSNEFALSEETARALELHLGDSIDGAVDESRYGSVLEPLVLVGILEGTSAAPGIRVGFLSYEYLEAHELYAPRTVSTLVVTREGHRDTVNEFLEASVASARTEAETYKDVLEVAASARRFLYLTFGIVNCLVAIAVAVVVGVINQIALMHRISELGLLHALGHHRRKLIRRLTTETAGVAGLGWIAGLAIALLFLSQLKAGLYYARGMELDLANPVPLALVTPIPLMVVALAILSLRRLFARLDAVAIVERGKISVERPGQKGRRQACSSPRPLSAWTFYRRHRRRGIALVASAALLIVGVALPTFLLSATADAMKPNFEVLRHVSELAPNSGQTVDAEVVGRVRSHPGVERVIPVTSLGLQIDVPPGGVMVAHVYGVAEDDLPILAGALGLEITQGRWPHPRSNEIALSASAARNRGLNVGDRIGTPAYERGDFAQLAGDDVPIELTVVGILYPRAGGRRSGETLTSSTTWLGLASGEYLESHEATSSRRVHLLVVPANGHKDEVDAWLNETVASARTDVDTYGVAYREHQQVVRGLLVAFATFGGATATVAAIAMATLNYIFFAQRREEFGVLHAVGRSRRWLILRTLKETSSTVIVAWIAGATLCVVGLIGFQALVYAPRGLYLNLFNPTPWLLTLPIPLAVVTLGTGTIGWMLSRFDPLAVIERRQA